MIIQDYNAITNEINQAKTRENISDLTQNFRGFCQMYESTEPDTVGKVRENYENKINNMIDNNTKEIDILSVAIKEQKDKMFIPAKDNSKNIENALLKLMAELPKSASKDDYLTKNILNQYIDSGIEGASAVLSLLKYPAYADLIEESTKNKALEHSKTREEKRFEEEKQYLIEKMEKEYSGLLMDNFQLRNILSRNTKKPSVFREAI